MATKNDFPFAKYNKLMSKANSGLQLYLAQQLMEGVARVMTQYKNPLAKDLQDVIDELAFVRSEGKKQAEKRANAGNTEEIDDPHANAKASSSADSAKVDATK